MYTEMMFFCGFSILFYSSIFSVIEEVYRYAIDRTHTTFAMWMVNNLFICPILVFIEIYLHYFYTMLFLFPIIIWFAEIIVHKLSKALFGRNIMWDYTGEHFARFDGAIRLDYYPVWMLLFIIGYFTILPCKNCFINMVL